MLKKPKLVRSEAAFMELLKKESLFLCPGSDFEMRNHFRLHLMAPPHEFKKALRKIVSLYRREASGGG